LRRAARDEDQAPLMFFFARYGNGMRFATPLNVKKEEIDEGLQILEEAICEVEAG